MNPIRLEVWLCVAIAAASLAGCEQESPDGDDTRTPAKGEAQTPPQGYVAIEAWLKTGVYKDWQCEAEVHAARSPSPHGFNASARMT
jgi:hypothetical protein